MRLTLAGAALCLSVAVQAQDDCVTLTWNHPAQRTDGSALDLSEIQNTGIYSSQSSDPQDVEASPDMEIVPAPADEITICGYAPGEWHFGAKTVDMAGLVSDLSNLTSKTIPDPRPAPPSNLAVQEGEQTAYVLQQSPDRLALVPAGSVPAGTPCDGSQSIRDANGRFGYVVPRDALQPAQEDFRGEVVVASCSGG